MDYTIKKYFDSNECSDIINYCMDNGEVFSYNPNENWDCRRIYIKEFKERILKNFINEYNSNDFNISLTRYYDGRFLNLHKDRSSHLTTVIVLSENFKDGRFVVSDKCGNDISDMRTDSDKIHLNIGEGITFDGSNVYHGVMPVYDGMRCALNIWMVDSDYNYSKFKNTKTLL